MSSTVVGIFEYTSEAQEAQKYLLANGFSSDNVDIKTSSTTTGTDYTADTHKKDDSSDGIGNFFKNLFGDDDDDLDRYTEAGRKGTILTVHARTADEAEKAARILDNYGAVDIDEDTTKSSYTDSTLSTGSVLSTDTAYVDPTLSTGLTDTTLSTGVTDSTLSTGTTLGDNVTGTGSIPVIKEELLVGKREVQTGGVRLKSRIVHRPVEESIRLREEFVSVERTSVDRLATEADFTTFKEGTIEVIEHAEVPVVSKEARVVEEVSLVKDVDEREEVISDTVRSTQVEVEDLTDEESLRKSKLDL
jgi:stress response protein YsnF